MHRYDYTALHRDCLDNLEPAHHPSSGPDSIASTVSSASESIHDEYKAKYERLQEAYKRLQRNNISLEEKLLNVSEKFSADKNLISRDLATQTQKVVEAKLTIQQLNKENCQLKADLKIALKLLQNKPSAFVHQKLNSLPSDLQNRVRDYSREKERERNTRNCGQRISVPIPAGSAGYGAEVEDDEAISAAILAKVLEQRERERNKDKEFCIDIGTQTHDWIFPDPLSTTVDKPRRGNSADEFFPPITDKLDDRGQPISVEDSGLLGGGGTLVAESDESGDSRGTKTSSTSKSQSWESDFDSEGSEFRRNHVSNLLLASVIQPPPPEHEVATSQNANSRLKVNHVPTISTNSNTAECFGASDRCLPSTIKKSPRKPPAAENPHNGSAVHRNAGNGSLPQHKNGGHRIAHQKDKLQDGGQRVDRQLPTDKSQGQDRERDRSRLAEDRRDERIPDRIQDRIQTTLSGDRRPWETTIQGVRINHFRSSAPPSSDESGSSVSVRRSTTLDQINAGREMAAGVSRPPFSHTSSMASIITRSSVEGVVAPGDTLSGSVSLASSSHQSRSGSLAMTRSQSYSSKQTDL